MKIKESFRIGTEKSSLKEWLILRISSSTAFTKRLKSILS